MALTFPLARAQFMDLLPIASITFDCPEQMFHSRTAGGEVLPADLGPRLWQGTVELGLMLPDESAAVIPLINLLRGAGRSFFVCDVRRPWPRLDPRGTLLGGATPQISQVAANAREMALMGLPAGYRLSAGDMLSFSYGANPTRHALHELVTSAEASAAGVSGLFEVSPSIRPGAAVNAAVALIRPVCKALLVPASVQPGRSRRGLTEGASFQFIQTLR